MGSFRVDLENCHPADLKVSFPVAAVNSGVIEKFTDVSIPLTLADESSRKTLLDKEMGARIREGREARHYTQSQLDAAAGLPAGSVKQIEAGSGAGEKRLGPIADALGLTVPYLRYGIPSAIDITALQEAAFQEGRKQALVEVQSFLVYLREHGELSGALEAMLGDETIQILDGGELGGGQDQPALPPAEYVPRPVPRPVEQPHKGRKRG